MTTAVPDRRASAAGEGDREAADQPEFAASWALAEALLHAVLMLDDEGKICAVNQATQNLFARSARAMLGRRLTEICTIEDSRVEAKLTEADAQTIARRVPITISGERRGLDLTISPIASDEALRLVTMIDSGQEESSAVPSSRAGFSAPSVLAHEIKNPLAAIRAAGQLIVRRLASEDRALADIVIAEADRIAELIDRMQLLGRSSALKRRPCNLHQSLRNAAASLRLAYGEKGIAFDGADDRAIALREEFDPSLPDVLADPSALEQVWINLIGNAIDALQSHRPSRDESRTILVRTRYVSGQAIRTRDGTAQERLPVEVAIIDNGPGVDEAVAERLFEPFVTSKPSGQGLGLALVRKLLDEMGGRIAHQRDTRTGRTIFKVHLPTFDARAETTGDGKGGAT